MLTAKTLLRVLVNLSIVPAVFLVSYQFASAATQAGMVTLLVPDLVSPDLFRYYIPAYLACLYYAMYLALTNHAGMPNYWHCAGVLLALPAMDVVHDHLVMALTGPYLHGYLIFVTGYTLLLMLLTLCGRKRNRTAPESDAAKPSVSGGAEVSKP